MNSNSRQGTLLLRLGVHQLPAIERVVIKTIVQLSVHDADFAWKLVDEPPYDALLIDGAAFEDAKEIASTARVTLRLTRARSADMPNTLVRPIRAEKFQQLLKQIQGELLEEQSAQSATDDDATTRIDIPDSVRFMLRRWPPALLLANDPGKVRMASLLVRRELSVIEVADLSQQPPAQCAAFLWSLHKAGVLERCAEKSVSRSPELQSAPDRARLLPHAHLSRGLLNSIRRRLGLHSS